MAGKKSSRSRKAPSARDRRRGAGVERPVSLEGTKDNYIRDWGEEGMSIAAQGPTNQTQKEIVARLKAAEQIRPLQNKLDAAQKALEGSPRDPIFQERVKLYTKQLREAEALAHGGSPEK